MRRRVRAVCLASAALVALAPASGAAAHTGPPPSRTAADQPLTWRIVTSANVKKHGNSLAGVSCPSAGFCAAVGSVGSHGAPMTLVETWNGTAWSIVPSPNRMPVSELHSVSCISATACTAVGASDAAKASPAPRTLIETWNGTAWSLVPSPNPSTGQGFDLLSSVSCVSAAFCAAVGSRGKSPSNDRTLTEIWNGTAWSVASSPDEGSSSSLSGVSCVSARSCTAVGGQAASGIVSKPLIESWNGAKWSVVPSPGRGNRGNSGLAGVSCVSASACTAVGTYYGSISFRTLAESWNGTAWSVVPSPNAGPGRADNTLEGTSCTSASACVAVGINADSGPLIEAWDGTAWSIETSPSKRGFASLFYSVSCSSSAMCMAVGIHDFSRMQGGTRTLAVLGTSSG